MAAASIRGGTPALAQGMVALDRSGQTTWSASLQSVLDQPVASLPSRLMLAGLVFCGVFMAWAWFGRVQEVGHATGQLIPQGHVYKVQSATPGEIVRLLVKPGQRVKSGQLIAELDSRLAEAEVDRLQQTLAMDRLQLIQAQELLNRTAFEAESRRSISLAQAHAREAALIKAEAHKTTQRVVAEQAQTDLDAAKQRLERLKPLWDEGVIAREQVFEVEQDLRDRQRALTQTQGELESRAAEVQQVQAELSQQHGEIERIELETQQRLQQLKMDVTTLSAKISETENLLRSAKTQLQSTLLYAPVSGTVSSLYINNIGEFARPGDTLVEIAPENAPLILSAIIPNREAGLVQPKMTVQIKFDAFPFQEYGIVTGKVLSISPDAEQNERLGAVYRVDVALDRTTLQHRDQTIQFRVGQTANAEIVIRQRRVLDLLLQPFQALQRDSLKL
ncbi:MAG: HlyD family efflux transporter periplasmic adaptor subunit [Oculatellaceae cyanobacterium Prado106]|nr:HlyD family efflux transporter periplasmic adaptor subunit [Oculatellaceae cyanobacterium Prado106]